MTIQRCGIPLNFLLDSAGFKVTLFTSVLDFLAAMPGLGFGCVVSDVRMPGLDGIDLLKRLKSDNKQLPVIIMTGHGDVPLAVEAMKLGALDFLEKPFEDERLVNTIKVVLSRTADERKGESVAADIAAPNRHAEVRGTAGHGRPCRWAFQQADRAGLHTSAPGPSRFTGKRDDENAGRQHLRTGAARHARRNPQGLR